MSDLEATARALVAEGKGILAADESTSTIKKRFDSIGVESTEENRRAYRELLFTTEGVEEFISGVILFDETIRQSSADGTPFPQLLDSKGIIPGIKVDMGAKPLALADGETITEGLDGLRPRLEEYRDLGARFALGVLGLVGLVGLVGLLGLLGLLGLERLGLDGRRARGPRVVAPEQLDPVLAGLLGAIHRAVGAAHEVLAVARLALGVRRDEAGIR